MIGPDGSQLGIMATRDAQSLADSNGLDLVEVAPTARPPVCRIMDYGKYKFEQAKKTREAKSKQHRVKVKEVKMKLKISGHDYDFKLRHAVQFLEEGNKVKFRIIFRGRELSRPERGRALADKIAEAVDEYAIVDSPPQHAGREMIMVVSPRPGLREKAARRREKAKAEAAKPRVEAPVAPTPKVSGPKRPRSIMAAGLDRARQMADAARVETGDEDGVAVAEPPADAAAEPADAAAESADAAAESAEPAAEPAESPAAAVASVAEAGDAENEGTRED